MGYTEFLTGQNAPMPSNLSGAIDDLEDASHTFVRRWSEQALDRAGDVSKTAMVLLDFIVNELLRHQVERRGLGTYNGSPLATALLAPCGRGASGATLADQQAMVHVGAGTGGIPVCLGAPFALDLGRLLNKIKHRNPLLMNFRIDAGRHIFVVCTEHTPGGAEGIYEFDVVDFCRACKSAVSAL